MLVIHCSNSNCFEHHFLGLVDGFVVFLEIFKKQILKFCCLKPQKSTPQKPPLANGLDYQLYKMAGDVTKSLKLNSGVYFMNVAIYYRCLLIGGYTLIRFVCNPELPCTPFINYFDRLSMLFLISIN